jgi:signal transduction histidine kinase
MARNRPFKRKRDRIKSISIRTSIFRNFTVMIILILLSFSGVVLFLQYSELSVLSRRLIMEATDQIETEIQRTFQPVIKNISISAHWGRSKRFSQFESAEMLKMYMPVLNEFEHIYRIKSSDQYGNGFSLSKSMEDDDVWITKRTIADAKNPTRAVISRWDDDQEMIDKRWENSGEDLREQTWYKRTIHEDGYRLVWDEPYHLENSNNMLITASIKITSGYDDFYVLAFDILLTDLQEIMREMVISENSIVFISTMDERFVGFSGNILKESGYQNNELILHPISNFNIQPVNNLLEEWHSKKIKRLNKVIHFSVDRDRWVGSLIEFPSVGIPVLKIGMLAPISDVMHYDVTRGVFIFLIFILALIMAVIMTRKMAKNYIKPVQQILNQSIKISQGDLRKGEHPSSCGIKELKQLADTHESMRQALEESRNKLEDYSETLSQKVEERTFELNKKSEELEELNATLEQRVRDEVNANQKKDQLMLKSARQAQMGEMLSMIAHQWRQPLSSISTITGNLMVYLELDTYNKEQFMELLTNINDHAQFLSRTINDFRDFFNPKKKKKSVLLTDILEQTINIIGRSLEYKSIELKKDYSISDPIITYPNEITQVFLNIIKNAQDIIIEKQVKHPEIAIRVFQVENEQVIEISDNAGGISEGIIESVFDPYFSTKDEKTGTGLGLYMSRLIIEKHCKGKIYVENREHGACFIINMPMLREEEI